MQRVRIQGKLRDSKIEYESKKRLLSVFDLNEHLSGYYLVRGICWIRNDENDVFWTTARNFKIYRAGSIFSQKTVASKGYEIWSVVHGEYTVADGDL